MLSDEHIEYKWVTRDKIKDLDLVKGREEIIKFTKLNWMNW